MNLIQTLRRPRESLRKYTDYVRLGRDMDRLRRTPFYSGLGDTAWLLYALARSLKPKVCVEIGTARGKSSCFVGKALQENGSGVLYAIDPHTQTSWNDDHSVETYEIVRSHLADLGLEGYVEIIRKTSAEAAEGWDREIDLLFIDGDHSYDGVKRDWDLYTPHLTTFGVVLFHDTGWELERDRRQDSRRDDMGVPKFVDELRRSGFPVITLPCDCGLTIVQNRIGGIPLRAGDQNGAGWPKKSVADVR